MLVTRPEPDASETAARLGALGIDGLACPLLVHQTLTPNLPDATGFAAIAVTSTNALRALRERGMLERYLKLPLYAVGARTAAAAKSLGFDPENPMVRSEVGRIVLRGDGERKRPSRPSSALALGYSEEPVDDAAGTSPASAPTVQSPTQNVLPSPSNPATAPTAIPGTRTAWWLFGAGIVATFLAGLGVARRGLRRHS